jgi:hypothetical protein
VVTAGSLVVTRNADVRELLTRRADIELTFIQNRASSVVHVITPRDPDPTPNVSADDVSLDRLIDALVGACSTLCGYRAQRHRGGFENGDPRVHQFPDDQLCGTCVRVLGPHAPRAFEHPQPNVGEREGDGDASTS